MMRDLFSVDQRFEAVEMSDADVSILHGLEVPIPYEAMLDKLITDIEWKQESVRIYGKVMPQPRLIAWYGDPGKKYDYSGISLTPLPWSDLLREIRLRVEDCTEERFNSVFLNLYRDHDDSMGFHSDDERELGPEPSIASVTFGATRTFVMKHKKNADLPSMKIPRGWIGTANEGRDAALLETRHSEAGTSLRASGEPHVPYDFRSIGRFYGYSCRYACKLRDDDGGYRFRSSFGELASFAR